MINDHVFVNLFSCKRLWMLSKTDSQQINSGSAPGNFTLSPKQKEIKAGNFFSSGPQRLFQIKKKLRWQILWKLPKTNIYLCHDVFKNISVLLTYIIWQYFHSPPDFTYILATQQVFVFHLNFQSFGFWVCATNTCHIFNFR